MSPTTALLLTVTDSPDFHVLGIGMRQHNPDQGVGVMGAGQVEFGRCGARTLGPFAASHPCIRAVFRVHASTLQTIARTCPRAVGGHQPGGWPLPFANARLPSLIGWPQSPSLSPSAHVTSPARTRTNSRSHRRPRPFRQLTGSSSLQRHAAAGLSGDWIRPRTAFASIDSLPFLTNPAGAWGPSRRSNTSATVAATDVYHFSDHSLYRGPYNYDNILAYNGIGEPRFPPTFSPTERRSQTRPWSHAKDSEGHRREDLMSERPQSLGVPASSGSGDNPRPAHYTLTSASPAQGPHRTASASDSGLSTDSQQRGARWLELPPLSGANSARPDTFFPAAPRVVGVSSILNPPADEGAQTGQRRKASQLESPISSAHQLPPLAPSVRNASGGLGPPYRSDNAPQDLSPRPPRRVLTPRSPSGLHRTASLGQLNPQGGSINAQQVPFPPSPRSRVYTVEPGTSGAPPLPTPSARAHPAGYGFPPPPPPRDSSRRASTGTNRARNLSSSASPSTSYSSYSQVGQTSPMGTHASTAGGAPASHDNNGDPSGREQRTASDPAASDSQRHMSIPISSGGQNVYQMMTLETTSGTVQLPVDVQAASRVADEKRRRNAGASARFRQRRKEKEREASTSIARLEQQVKELAEDLDFYRNERGQLLSILQGVSGMEHHLQRPPSPRQMRGSMGSMRGSMAGRQGSYMRPSVSQPQSPDTGRNVRRRTSTFSLPAAPSSQLPPPPGPPLQPSYPPSGYSTPITPQTPVLPSPHARQSLPAPSQRPFGQPQQPLQQPAPGPLGPPPIMQTQPQTGPFNPYERKFSEPGPQEGR